MFGMKNLLLIILTTLIAFAVFGVFYVVMYRFPAGAYYSIVSGARQEPNLFSLTFLPLRFIMNTIPFRPGKDSEMIV